MLLPSTCSPLLTSSTLLVSLQRKQRNQRSCEMLLLSTCSPLTSSTLLVSLERATMLVLQLLLYKNFQSSLKTSP